MQFASTNLEALDNALASLGDNLEQLRDAIETAEPELRPAYDKEYASILQVASTHAPGTDEAQSFSKEADDASPYHEQENFNSENIDHPEFIAAVEKSLAGTGINTQEAIQRISLGADSQFLEAQWIIRDMQSVARTNGLDLTEDLEEIRGKLSVTYAELKSDLVEYRALPLSAVQKPVAQENPTNERTTSEATGPEYSETKHEAINGLLQHHQSGRVAVSDSVRSEAANAIREVLAQAEYDEILDGKITPMNRFTDDRTEQLYLSTIVLKNEIVENGRGDLRLTHAKLKNEHTSEVRGYDNDPAW